MKWEISASVIKLTDIIIPRHSEAISKDVR